MKKWLILLSTSLLLFGCENQEIGTPPTKVPVEQTVSLLDFFPKAPMEKHFLGIGNEFAQYKETFYQQEGDYLPSVIDNGGTRTLRIYKVTNQEISIVYEQPEFYDETPPFLSTLEHAFKNEPLLALPLKKGKKIGDWKIVKLNAEVNVPYGQFSNVILIEKINPDGSVNRQYWVENYGKIKDEYFQHDENGDNITISSELQAIK